MARLEDLFDIDDGRGTAVGTEITQCAAPALPSLRAELDSPVLARQFGQVLASLERLRDGPQQHAVLVTSADDREVKTLTAIELALALADRAIHVLLLDADGHSPGVHEWLGIPEDPGMVDVVAGRMNRWPIREVSPCLNVLTGGHADEPDGVRYADVLPRLLSIYGGTFEWIVIDGPCVSEREAASLMRLVPAVVFVIDAGSAFRGATNGLAALPPGSRLGTVLRSSPSRPPSRRVPASSRTSAR